jgi:hypothetical protein
MPALIAALMPVTIHWTARPVVSAPVSAITNPCREVARSQRLPFFSLEDAGTLIQSVGNRWAA